MSLTLPITACEQSAPTALSEADGVSAVAGERAVPAPGAGHGRGFFPLEIGNRWAYSRTLSFQMIEGGIPQPPEIHLGSVTAELTRMETLFGREYMVEERHILIPSLFEDTREWVRYRQDRSGLYEADVSLTQPPGGPAAASGAGQPMVVPVPASLAARAGDAGFLEAWRSLWERYERVRGLAREAGAAAPAAPGRPGGVLSDELTRLAYPLHPKASWTVREVPLFTSTVEAVDALDTGAGKVPAYRIRMESGLFGPNDVALFWMGRRGLVRSFVHAEAEIFDPAGNPLGVIVLESEDLLDVLDLERPGAGPSRPGETIAGM